MKPNKKYFDIIEELYKDKIIDLENYEEMQFQLYKEEFEILDEFFEKYNK